jgi:hypothetical protein
MVTLWFACGEVIFFSLPAVDRTYCEHPHVLGFEGREGPRWSELRHGSTVWTAAVPLSPLWTRWLEINGFTVIHQGAARPSWDAKWWVWSWWCEPHLVPEKTLGLHATAGYIHSSMWIQLYPIVSRDIRHIDVMTNINRWKIFDSMNLFLSTQGSKML